MKKILSIQNLFINVGNKEVLKNISLTFYEGVSTFLCGTCGSGKTTLLKAIAKNQGITSYTNFFVVFDKCDFQSNTVSEELKYESLSPLQKEFVHQFFREDLLQQNPNTLSFYQQKILLLCSSFSKNVQCLFIDNIYSFLTNQDIKKFTDFFSQNKITVILVSTNIDLAPYYQYMIVMDRGIIALEGKTMEVLKEEKLLNRLGIGLPFYVNLSKQLQYYNLIDKVYLGEKELADQLWK